MKTISSIVVLSIILAFAVISCKKNQPTSKIEGTYTGHFEGVVDGNDTIVNTGYKVTVTRIDKNIATVTASLFDQFEVLVTPNGINVELVSPTDGLSDDFLYEGETKTLSFMYVKDGDTAIYNGTK